MYVLVKQSEIHHIEGSPTVTSVRLYHSRFKFMVKMKMDNDYKKLIKFLEKRSDWTDNGKTLRHNRNDGENAAIFYFDNSVREYNPYYRISSTTFHIYRSRELVLKDSDSVVVK